jgi:hypothetical protein
LRPPGKRTGPAGKRLAAGEELKGIVMEKRKVIARKTNGEILKGYVDTAPESAKDDKITMISLTDEIIKIPKRNMKALFFVKKFSGNKEYSEIKFFENQPKIDGLWVRLTFYDDEMIEGIVSNTIGFLLEEGFYLKPPDPNSNNRLMYVLKAALKDFTVLGVQYSKGNITDYYEKLRDLKNPADDPPRK